MKTLSLLLVLALPGLGACSSAGAQQSEAKTDFQSIRVIPLQFAPAIDVARTLAPLSPESRIVPDGRTNSVLVACDSEAEMVRLVDCIAKLDVEVKAGK